MIAALALDWLDKNRRDLIRRRGPLQNRLLDLAYTAALSSCHAVRAAAREWNVVNVRDQRGETAAMNQLRAGQRHGTISPSVECPEKRNGTRPAGVPARELERSFESFRPAIG